MLLRDTRIRHGFTVPPSPEGKAFVLQGQGVTGGEAGEPGTQDGFENCVLFLPGAVACIVPGRVGQ